MGTIQAAEALKSILQVGETLAGQLLVVDMLTLTFSKIRVSRIPECPACGSDSQDLINTFNYDV
jgi:adenylyltransferase/sulfurtransferase